MPKNRILSGRVIFIAAVASIILGFLSQQPGPPLETGITLVVANVLSALFFYLTFSERGQKALPEIWRKYQLLLVGTGGMAVSIGIGSFAILPWAFAGPAAVLFLSLPLNHYREILKEQTALSAQTVTNARELAERVYAPIRTEVKTWIEEPEYPQYRTWPELNVTLPHLTRSLPEPLQDFLNKARPVCERIVALRMSLHELVPNSTHIQVYRGQSPVFGVYITNLWESGKTLKRHAQDQMDKIYPGGEIRLTLNVDNKMVGGDKEAEDFARDRLAFLETQLAAREIREKIQELQTVGKNALPLIEKELDRLSLRMKV